METTRPQSAMIGFGALLAVCQRTSITLARQRPRWNVHNQSWRPAARRCACSSTGKNASVTAVQRQTEQAQQQQPAVDLAAVLGNIRAALQLDRVEGLEVGNIVDNTC